MSALDGWEALVSCAVVIVYMFPSMEVPGLDVLAMAAMTLEAVTILLHFGSSNTIPVVAGMAGEDPLCPVLRPSLCSQLHPMLLRKQADGCARELLLTLQCRYNHPPSMTLTNSIVS